MNSQAGADPGNRVVDRDGESSASVIDDSREASSGGADPSERTRSLASISDSTPGSSLGLTFDQGPTETVRAAVDAGLTSSSPAATDADVAFAAALSATDSQRTPKQAHFTLDPPETRTISPAPRRRPSYHQQRSFSTPPSTSAPTPPLPTADPAPESSPPLPKPTLVQTYKDLHSLLKGFLLLVPPFIRNLRYLIPTPLRAAARFVIRYSAMFLHSRGILGSNWVYDVVASMWRVVIDIFFREIRSRGAWKIPRQNEGAVIFVVGPHHNQVSRFVLAPSLGVARS